jgi:tRNA 2-thiouridine synthesizing protein A
MKLTARDPGAPADIPAWCRMTGNPLVGGQPPVYLIQRKED